MDVEQISSKGEVLAIIVRSGFSRPGVHFFTPGEFSQQLGYMQHEMGKTIQPHVHTPVQRAVEYTQEVLFVRRGKLRVDFYSPDRKYLESRVLSAGDVILLASAGVFRRHPRVIYLSGYTGGQVNTAIPKLGFHTHKRHPKTLDYFRNFPVPDP